MPNAWRRTTQLLKDYPKAVLLACGFGAFGNLALLQGLAAGQATAVLVTVEAFLVLTLVGEHIFLKEKRSFGSNWQLYFWPLLAPY